MAGPETAGVNEFLAYIEVPTQPGVWHFLCGVNSHGFNGTLNVSETPLRDCDSPTALATRRVTPNYFSEEFTGSGVMAKEFFPIVEAAYKAGNDVTLRVGISAFGYWQGPFLISARNVGAESEGFVTCEITLMSDGDVPFLESASFPAVA